VPANGYSSQPPDRSSAVVTAGVLLLAVLGVVTVFYEPIAAVLSPEPSAAPAEASGAPTEARGEASVPRAEARAGRTP
jgi:uncharacterized iron-regulated membrane protein